MEFLYLIVVIETFVVLASIIVSLYLKFKTVSKQELQKQTELLNNLNVCYNVEIEKNKISFENLSKSQNLIEELNKELRIRSTETNEALQNVSELRAINNSLLEKLNTQKVEIEEVKNQFKLEFQNIANQILEEKTQKFTDLNKVNLEAILKPLGDNLDNFKRKVEEVYDKESKERFSLGSEIQRLVALNQQVSVEANNLTNALKGNSKIQGDWGQMILENILEKSGLVKGREYFVQEFLKDDDDKYFKNEDGTKMQPDVIIQFPDNRKVLIDSKVSLTAYARYAQAELFEEQKNSSNEHLKSVRKHVDELSKKNYQDFAASLDYVLMFVPCEPAYLLALQNDTELWQYAYNKRIVLISPTNLIAVLKIIADIWKRDYQNQNALDIAERGGQLYDKFVGFVDSLNDIGANIEKAQKSYSNALSQLKDGRGNLIRQAEQLRELGVKTKKNLPSNLLIE